MLILQAIILGIIQGLTEFIPISSSAHLIIVPWLFGWNDPALTSLPFDVALHLGTLLAVLAYFARDWQRVLRAGVASVIERKIDSDPDRRFAWLLVIATVPGAIAGVLVESKIESMFHQPGQPVAMPAILILACAIAWMGLFLWLADRLGRRERKLDALSFKDGILIGCAQALAIFPGVSRSGSTITAGLALGYEREAAARFSFMLSAPIIAGAGVVSLLKLGVMVARGGLSSSELVLFPVGFVAAALSGFLTIKYLLRYLQRNSTAIFVYYRWAQAAFIAAVALLRG